MPSLLELQQSFGAAVFGGESAALIATIEPKGMDPAERVDIYRNNYRLGFRKALALSFPVIERLVGSAYFSRLALEYQASHPSRCGDLHHIGGAFPGFLRQRFAVGDYLYLPDTAVLEWAIQEIMIAERPAPATIEDLRQIDPEAYGALRLSLHPAVRLVSSHYPVVRIWMSNQAGATPEIVELHAGADQVLVSEGFDGLEFHRLREPEFALAAALDEGLTLGPAAERALAFADESFDLARALHRLLSAGALILSPCTRLGVQRCETAT